MNALVIGAAVVGVLALVALAIVLARMRDGGRDQTLERAGLRDRLPPGRVLAIGAVLALLGLGTAYLSVTLFPLGMAVTLWGALLAGMALLPGTAYVLGRSLGPIGGALGKLYVIMGLLPFDRPVLYLTDEGEQVLKEADDLDDDTDITWYRFAKSWLGFAYANEEDNWPGIDTTMAPATVAELGEAVSDGGADPTASLPAGYLPTTQVSYAGHEGVVPKRTDDGTVYVQTHHVTSWYKDVGRGELLMKAYSYAKEKYGHGSPPIDERWVMGLSLVMALFGAAFGWWMFF